jgi:hypothetical protein
MIHVKVRINVGFYFINQKIYIYIYIYIYMHALVRFAEKYIYFDKIDSCVKTSLLP